jgi:hypothetical protein
VILSVLQAWTTAAVAVGLGAASTAVLGIFIEQVKSQEQWPQNLAGAHPGRVPRVREAGDPADWVAQPAGRESWSETPYVERDVDTELSDLLPRGGFVLLLGESAAGKSRTAYEAVRRTLPDHACGSVRENGQRMFAGLGGSRPGRTNRNVHGFRFWLTFRGV